MSISFRCEGCGKGYRVADDKGGKKMRCPNCEMVNQIPANEEPDDFGDLDDDYGAAPAVAPLGQARRASPAKRTPTKTSKAAKAPKAKSGSGDGGKSILMVGAGAAGFIVAFALAFFAVRGLMNRVGSVGGGSVGLLQYAPSDCVGAIIFHPAKLLKSEVLSPHVHDDVGVQMTQRLGIDPYRVESMAILMKGGQAGKPPAANSGVMLFRFTEPSDTNSIVEKTFKPVRVDDVSHNGKPYKKLSMVERTMQYTAEGPKEILGAELPPMGAFVPDDLTLVVAPEDDIRAAIDGRPASGRLIDRLNKFGSENHVTAVFLVDQSGNELNAAANADAAKMVPGMATVASFTDSIKEVALSWDLDAKTMMEVELDAKDEASAEKVLAAIEERIAALNKLVDELKQHPMAKFPGGIQKVHGEIAGLAERVSKTISVDHSGERVNIHLKNPGGFTRIIDETYAGFTAGVVEEKKMAKVRKKYPDGADPATAD